MPYTIKLIALECFRAQELDGDEIYVKLDDSRIWEAHPDHMSHTLEQADHVSTYHFDEGRKLTREGWLPMMPFNPDDFTYRDRSGGSVIQLWDADTLTRDDLLGQTPVDATQATGGNISVIFQRDGAHYRLTYRVEA